MKLIIPIVMSLSLAITSLSMAQNQPGPYKLVPSEPVVNNMKLLTQSYEQTGTVIAFVENNLQLSQLCDERLGSEKYTKAFVNWFKTQKPNFNATLDFKFTYEKILASLYGDSIIETFKKRDRLTLKQVSNDIELIAARDDQSFTNSCSNWYVSIEDKTSFFHSKLSVGLTYFGLNKEKLAIMVVDPANW
ncbi:MAG: hypothetical protein HRU38_08155 [Saccharospirillaceae bacterium]|nr:hypothetical protein [Pseudomonadales bacterium]NRB78626.1 hypothetical protein [Saccharospirillaceae bacterium]